MRDNYPERWKQHYENNNHAAMDPIIRLVLRRKTPLLWSKEVFANAEPVWRATNDCGMRHGWSIPAPVSPGYIGILSLVRTENPITHAELRRLNVEGRMMMELAHIGLHNATDETGASDLFPPLPNPNLTQRELEILSLEAEGLPRREIGRILGIRKRTADFHAKQINIKLATRNSAHAVMQAVRYGLITPIKALPRKVSRMP
jgi:LuxR family transcriptional regulator